MHQLERRKEEAGGKQEDFSFQNHAFISVLLFTSV